MSSVNCASDALTVARQLTPAKRMQSSCNGPLSVNGTSPGDACNAPPGSVDPALTCVLATCGNGVVEAGEECDDDNTTPTALVYAWSFAEQPGGSTATLSDAGTSTPSFGYQDSPLLPK